MKAQGGTHLVEAIDRDSRRAAGPARHKVKHRARRVALQQPPEEARAEADGGADQRLVDGVVGDDEGTRGDGFVAQDRTPRRGRPVPQLPDWELPVYLEGGGVALPRGKRIAVPLLAFGFEQALE